MSVFILEWMENGGGGGGGEGKENVCSLISPKEDIFL